MIYDLNGNPITSYTISLESGEIMNAQFLIQCRTGYNLSGSPVSNALVEAKHNASGTWVAIETTPIDLSTWDGTRQTFDLRITAATVTEVQRAVENVRVGT